MADPKDLYQEMEKALEDFDKFLTDNQTNLKKAAAHINAALGGRLFELIDDLIALLLKIKDEVEKIKVTGIPGLDEISHMAKATEALLIVSKSLLGDADDAKVDKALGLVKVVSGLPSVDEAKGKITGFIDHIIIVLKDIKATTV